MLTALARNVTDTYNAAYAATLLAKAECSSG
jgi:hypothetical protein